MVGHAREHFAGLDVAVVSSLQAAVDAALSPCLTNRTPGR
jgi:hypothetical protein